MTVDEFIADLKDRRREASTDVAESNKAAPDSYGAGYYQGYLDAIKDILKEATGT